MKIDIIMACPVCLEEGYNSPRDYWLHDGPCQGVLTLDENAIVQCRKCRKKEKLTRMKLRCNNNRHDFSIPSTVGLAQAMSTSAQMANERTLAWLQNVIKQIS